MTATMPGKLDSLLFKGNAVIYGACSNPEDAVIGIDRHSKYQWLEGGAALTEAPPAMRRAVRKHGHLMVLEIPNGFVSGGLDMFLNKAFGVSGPPANIQCLIVAHSTVAVAATDTSILGGATAPTFSGTTQNALSKALTTPAPAAAASNAISGGITITQADVNASAGATFWPMNRMGLVNVAAATAGGLIDVIGNTAAQADPYSRTFSVDFSGSSTFTLNPVITITGVRRVADFPVL